MRSVFLIPSRKVPYHELQTQVLLLLLHHELVIIRVSMIEAAVVCLGSPTFRNTLTPQNQTSYSVPSIYSEMKKISWRSVAWVKLNALPVKQCPYILPQTPKLLAAFPFLDVSLFGNFRFSPPPNTYDAVHDFHLPSCRVGKVSLTNFIWFYVFFLFPLAFDQSDPMPTLGAPGDKS